MQNGYCLKMPREVYSGEGALDRIGPILKKYGAHRVAVFTDRGIAASGLLELPMQKIRQAGVQAILLDDLPPEPTWGQAQKLVDGCRAAGADFIVAVGGGSVMDTAKLASVLMTDVYGVRDLLKDPGLARKRVPAMMIPTTAGTGSEATPNAIVAVPEQELKIGIVSDEMIADVVILDAEMIRALPFKIAASTGVDALAHAIECWTSKKANPLSDIFALRALDMILNNILPACADPQDMEAKRQMQLASFWAGVAITASGTTAVHALSYPLGGKYHIAHGVSNAILLAPVMRFNEPCCRQRLAQAYDQCMHGEKLCGSDEEKSRHMIKWLENIVRELKIPVSLKEFGVGEQELDSLARAGMQVERLLVNNPREVSLEDARQLYRQVL